MLSTQVLHILEGLDLPLFHNFGSVVNVILNISFWLCVAVYNTVDILYIDILFYSLAKLTYLIVFL